MNILTLLIIAVSLAMDAFSVCIAAGVQIKRLTYRHYFRLAFHFGLFQFLMPIIGFYSGLVIESLISRFDHWIAFGLLAFIGIKMFWESLQAKEDSTAECKDPSRGATLILLAIATSIDAAAVGFSLAALQINIWTPSIIIGIICCFFSALGIYLGDKIGTFIGVWAERLGGIILLLIGIKILIEHLAA